MFKKEIRPAILAMFLISLGGVLLHLRIHSPSASLCNYIPAVLGFLTTIVVTFLFNYRATVAWAFLITMVAVVAGTVTMAYHSALAFAWGPTPVAFKTLLLDSTLADILILFAKVPLAIHVLRYFRPKAPAAHGRPA